MEVETNEQTTAVEMADGRKSETMTQVQDLAVVTTVQDLAVVTWLSSRNRDCGWRLPVVGAFLQGLRSAQHASQGPTDPPLV